MILTSDQKLQFCNQDIEVMNINPKDTLSIAFEQLENDVFPVIGKSNILETDTVFKVTSNLSIKVTKKTFNALQYFGTEFLVEPYKDYFKMISYKKDVFEEIDLNSEILDDETYIIEHLTLI